MLDNSGSRTGFWINIALALVVVTTTIWLSLYLTDTTSRLHTFGFSVGFVCFLELLIFSYFLLPFIPNFRRGLAWGVYPAIGILIFIFTIVCVLTIFLTGHMIKLYTVLLATETVLFLVILGALLTLNALRRPDEVIQQIEQKDAVNLLASAQKLYQRFQNHKERISAELFRDNDYWLRRLLERCSQCKPFGQSETTTVENEVKTNIAELCHMIDDIPLQSSETMSRTLKETLALTKQIVQALERRERLLIK